jgi:hypothetical protein
MLKALLEEIRLAETANGYLVNPQTTFDQRLLHGDPALP